VTSSITVFEAAMEKRTVYDKTAIENVEKRIKVRNKIMF